MYSLLVSLSLTVQYGRAILVMDRSFCTDIAGNSFTRMANSSVHLHIGECYLSSVILAVLVLDIISNSRGFDVRKYDPQTEERFMSTSGLVYLKSYFELTVKLEQFRQLMTLTS